MINDRIASESNLLRERGVTADDFQMRSFAALDSGSSVLVAAPTSSGKTLVAEYAIEKILMADKTVVYTTPIKALSNQKFKDLCNWLGKEKVGLLTGDNAIRPNAQVVVMTTEVLRNMIYTSSPALESLGLVVLDEVHFLQDPYRGPVWEEVIMQVPQSARLVCLSATVSNAQELAGWIGEVHSECEAIIETTRPVELHDHFLVFDKRHRRVQEFRTLRNGERNFEVERYLGKMTEQRSRGPQRRGGAVGRPRRNEVITHLDESDRLPAIFFVFSRQGCDDAVQSCLDHNVHFLDGREKSRVEQIVEQHTEEISEADLALLNYEKWLDGLKSGIASHHAGMVTPFKEAVEDCFTAGLLKVVFATETLAMGVNLPARSVVVEQLSRFRGEGHVVLTPGEYTQLTGRAGRRGIDSTGHAYSLWSPYESFSQLTQLAQSNEFVLESAFRPTYNMAANLMARAQREEALNLLEKSFAQYRASGHVVRLTKELEKGQASLKTAQVELQRLGVVDTKPATNSRKSSPDVSESLQQLRPGAVIARVHGSDTQHLLVLGTTSRRGGERRVRVVTPRGKVMMLTVNDFDVGPEVLSDLELPKPYAPNRREYQRTAAKLLKQQLTELGILIEVRHPDRDLRAERMKAHRRVETAEGRISTIREQMAVAEGGLVSSLVAIEEIMEIFECAASWQLSPRGEVLQGIFHEMDLLAALCVDGAVFDDVSPPELAGLISVLTYEHRSRLEPPAPWFPNRTCKQKVEEILRYSAKIRYEENKRGLPESRIPDPTIFGQVHGWASGHELSEVLDDDTPAGDFVRNIRQVIDLVGQLAETTHSQTLKNNAIEAGRLLDRGLVSAAARIQDSDEDDWRSDDH
ncbi:MAG: hypothetical protein CL456_10720 [Acidimicrobiaceae bacterium]|nr:hypothetical protein [Acidimicrobiaceae bacterium]|tara:strand:+ start:16712 stop:19300 length:2589 start_codon:yes stop_codon:yes gene_type:complete